MYKTQQKQQPWFLRRIVYFHHIEIANLEIIKALLIVLLIEEEIDIFHLTFRVLNGNEADEIDRTAHFFHIGDIPSSCKRILDFVNK